MKNINKLLVICCFFLFIGVIGVFFNFYFNQYENQSITGALIENTQNKNNKKLDIEVVETSLERNELGGVSVYGLIKNNLMKNLSYLEIIVKFYDFNGNLLSTQTESVSFIESGETWKFMVNYPRLDMDSVKDYKIVLGQYW